MNPGTDDSQHTAIDGVSRRSLLAWTGAAAAGALAAALPAPTPPAARLATARLEPPRCRPACRWRWTRAAWSST